MEYLTFEKALSEAVEARVDAQAQSVGGGSISEALRYQTSRGPVFVKRAGRSTTAMFAAEAEGLRELAAAAAIRVPRVIAMGESQHHAFLVLEWIDFKSSTHSSQALLGEQLAHQHRVTQTHFGWSRDNTIGSTAQKNALRASWLDFLREQRLGFQLELAARSDAPARLIERGWQLCEGIDAYFKTYRPQPSLLHGDLWSGNWRTELSGQPVVFDPAVYFGDREADIAMTRLFGGFGREFYAAYQTTWPLDEAWATRTDLYNLYHVLNHAHLFGGGYLHQAETMIDRLLAQLGH